MIVSSLLTIVIFIWLGLLWMAGTKNINLPETQSKLSATFISLEDEEFGRTIHVDFYDLRYSYIEERFSFDVNEKCEIVNSDGEIISLESLKVGDQLELFYNVNTFEMTSVDKIVLLGQ